MAIYIGKDANNFDLLAGKTDSNSQVIPEGVISSPDKSSRYTITLTQTEFNDLVNNNSLVEGTIYNITESSIYAQTTLPIGSSCIWYGDEDTIPANYMKAEGQYLSISDYPELFSVIGQTYTQLAVEGQFQLPDMQLNGVGRTPVHKTYGSVAGFPENNIGDVFGSNNYELRAHAGAVNGNSSTIGYKAENAIQGSSYTYAITGALNTVDFINHTTLVTDTEGSRTIENRQPSFVVLYIIKVKPESYSEDLRNLDIEVAKLSTRVKDLESGKELVLYESTSGLNLSSINGGETRQIGGLPSLNDYISLDYEIVLYIGYGSDVITKHTYSLFKTGVLFATTIRDFSGGNDIYFDQLMITNFLSTTWSVKNTAKKGIAADNSIVNLNYNTFYLYRVSVRKVR